MVQYGADGRVIPHYYGENYRGFDIFDTFRCFRGKWIKCWKGRNPYDDTDICSENIMHAPKNRCFKSRDEIVEYIEKSIFLDVFDNFISRLKTSILWCVHDVL